MDKSCDFLPPNPQGSDLSTQSWSRAFGPVLLRLPNKWLLVLWKSATLIFNTSSFFVLLLPFPHIILRFQCPAAMSDRKGTWCPMKNVSSEADTVWEFYYRDEVWSCDEINMFLRLRAVAGPASRDACAGVELDLCNTEYSLCWNKEALGLHLGSQTYLRIVVLKHCFLSWIRKRC